MLEGTLGRQRRSQPWEAGAGATDGVIWAAGGRRPEIEDTRQMLDVNQMAGRQNRLLTG